MPIVQLAPQEVFRILLVIGTLFYLFTSSSNKPPPGYASSQDYAKERIARSRQSISVLNSTSWQDFTPSGDERRWLNLTGFRENDGYAWDRLVAWQEKIHEFSEQVGSPRLGNGKDEMRQRAEFYRNVTGIVHGSWVRYSKDLEGFGERMSREMNLSVIAPGVEWLIKDQESWKMNVTGREGKLTMKFDERTGNEVQYDLRRLSDSPEAAQSQPGLVRDVTATMILQDEGSNSNGWRSRLHGVHWPEHGSMLLTTTSEKFAGIFGLPHLTSGLEYYTSSQELLNITLNESVKKMEDAVQSSPQNPWSSSPDGSGDVSMPVPHCEYIVFAQLQPLFGLGPHLARDAVQSPSPVARIEQDLRFPNGASFREVPKLQIPTVIFSPDCGFILESKGPPNWALVKGHHLVGPKQEVFLQSIRHLLLLLGAVICGQTYLWKVQVNEASTPSTMSRISLQSLAVMLLGDALLFASLSILAVSEVDVFQADLLASFAALMSVAVGAKFVNSIYNIQQPETRQTQTIAGATNVPTPSTPTPAVTPATIPAGADTVSLPVVASTSTTSSDEPVIIPSDQDIDAEIAETENNNSRNPILPTTNVARTQAQPQNQGPDFGAMYGKFVLVLGIILFLSLSSFNWPPMLRTTYAYITSFLYLSFWLPQIRRNIARNCRKALMWKFVLGQSILRLLPFAYFLLREDNMLLISNDRPAFCVLAGWVWIQIWVLAAQEILGPRYGIPKDWTEDGWDYHPILREDHLEAGNMPLGLVPLDDSPDLERVRKSESLGNHKKDQQQGTRSMDCAICMQVLEVPVVPAGSEDGAAAGITGGVAGIMVRRLYMVTPCRHVFHSACLEGWIKFRLQCPICRDSLPPL